MIDIHSEKLTIRQVQDETRLSHRTIQRGIASGKINAELINDVWFIPRSELSRLPKPRKLRGVPANVVTNHKPDAFPVNTIPVNTIPDEVKRELAYRAMGAYKSYENKELDILAYANVIIGASCTAMQSLPLSRLNMDS